MSTLVMIGIWIATIIATIWGILAIIGIIQGAIYTFFSHKDIDQSKQ